VFETRVLRRIFGLKREDVAVDWWKFHKDMFHDSYHSSDIIMTMESRRMRFTEHVP
jgi:hypothetical protein